MYKLKFRWLRAVCKICFFAMTSITAFGQGPITNQAEPTWTDDKTGLMWSRCAIGQQWRNGRCEGDIKLKNWYEAFESIRSFKVAGFQDWRVPTIAELESIRRCNKFFTETISIPTPEGMKSIPSRCEKYDDSPFLDTTIFPITPPFDIASTTRHVNNPEYYYYLGKAGYMLEKQRGWRDFVVIPVRGNPSTTEYNNGLTEAVAYMDREQSKRQAQAAAERTAKTEEDRRQKQYVEFRKNISPGDDTTDGIVIEVKGSLVKVQTNQSQCSQRNYEGKCINYVETPAEKWFKRTELYPK